ncbi:alpha/beta hydrolase-fold protein [Archangium primigenium]|uniref:alpha/beta hydrolase-fold protein n=1 Tax=[Archangium] primigenium TaxID=2792470 RepID=UPI001959B85B|nr:alpha/beta hydrolase-fold protein [Archangium primigenium]MBM7118571.1 alpha/beta hydrolase [Archangium primigenium]
MRFAPLSILLLALLPPWEALSAEPVEQGQPLFLGTRFTLHSDTLGEDRSFLVHLPPGYEASSERHVVLYLLDGDEHFHHVTGLVDFLARGGFIPPLIVVGISNTERARDLTPPVVGDARLPNAPTIRVAQALPSAGGAERFLRFLDEELRPRIEARYRTLPYRILVGHSYGGLFGLSTWVTRPQAFQALILSSPSLWWNHGQWARDAAQALGRLPPPERFLYMSMGNEGPAMLAPIQGLARTLSRTRPPGLRWHYAFLKKEHHVSTPHRTLAEGLESLFEGWIVPEYPATPGTLAKVEANYARLSQRLGLELHPAEDMLNGVGYQLLEQGHTRAALAALRRNAEWYAHSGNAWDSLGEALEAAGQWAEARDSYTRALALEPARPAFQRHLERVTARLRPPEP